MTSEPTVADNTNALIEELDWLEQVINQAVRHYLKQEDYEESWRSIAPPDFGDSTYASFCLDNDLGVEERLMLALGLAPHLKPQALDLMWGTNGNTERRFTEFGGQSDKAFTGLLPTGQTFTFLVTSDTTSATAEALDLLSPSSFLLKERVMCLAPMEASLPAFSGALYMDQSWLSYFLTGQQINTQMSSSFPAHRLETPLVWDDLVLDYKVLEQVHEIRTWVDHQERLMQDWGLARKIKPGFRALFYGPPGTGKSLTAALLGQETGLDVYRVDLSMVVSKYIGETEKNLGRIFDEARHKNWILFFDEADALFGKRTESNSSNDRHANQQTGYLLQRIEDFPGVVILATNLRSNMDDAFSRRFQTMIHFDMPAAGLRQQLWHKAFDGACPLAPDIDLDDVANSYELAGGSIINILRACALSAVHHEAGHVSREALMQSIRREFKKNNQTIH